MEEIYKIKMFTSNGRTEFETTNANEILKIFEKRKLIKFTQKNGVKVIHDTSKYYSIEVCKREDTLN